MFGTKVYLYSYESAIKKFCCLNGLHMFGDNAMSEVGHFPEGSHNE
jgi:hypothetical protein